MAKVLRQSQSDENRENVLLFYLERVMEQVESGCIYLAHATFERYRKDFSQLLKASHLERLGEITQIDNSWSPNQENQLYDRIKNAWQFGEYKTVHDCAHEILLHNHGQKNGNAARVEEIKDILASNNTYYIEPDSITVNTFINAQVDFIVEKRKSHSASQKPLQGNPGFYLNDALNNRYRCFIKQVSHVQKGDQLKLKITNIPGLAFATPKAKEPIVYLEPRVSPGDTIEIELGTLSHTENSFTFRFHSYDGFLWFKRRGVNKTLFNKNTLKPGDRIQARVLYTTEEEKRSPRGNITRLGIVKAVPIQKNEEETGLQENPGTDAAKALN